MNPNYVTRRVTITFDVFGPVKVLPIEGMRADLPKLFECHDGDYSFPVEMLRHAMALIVNGGREIIVDVEKPDIRVEDCPTLAFTPVVGEVEF